MLNSASIKILVVRFSSIGDVVLSSPLIRCLYRQLNAEIHVLVKPNFACLYRHSPYIKEVHIYNAKDNKHLEACNFDVVLDLQNNLRSRRVTGALGKRTFRLNKLNFEKWLYVNLGVDWLSKRPNLHVVERYLETAKHLGVVNDNEGLDLFLSEADRVDIETAFSGLVPNGYLAVAFGSQKATKQIPYKKLWELVNAFRGWPIVLLGGAEDVATAEKLAQEFNHVVSAVNKFSLLQSASIISQAKQVIAPDTGLMHIACAFKRPLTVVWGSTTPVFGFAPYLPTSGEGTCQQLQVPNLGCQPCSKLGYNRCPKGHHKCMALHDFSSIKIV